MAPLTVDGMAASDKSREIKAGEAGAPATAASDGDVAQFIQQLKSLATPQAGQRGRLVFAMDATMSRQPTWDMALALQAGMFDAVAEIGGLDVQLVYFRGANECAASRWVQDAAGLARLMSSVACRGGHTQIGRVLGHARQECETARVSALVYVGDAMEERVDDLAAKAGELALLGVPVFLFQEGHDPAAETAFREIARITKGAWCRFDQGAARQLRDLLAAVAAYAVGGRLALEQRGKSGSAGARLLLAQMK